MIHRRRHLSSRARFFVLMVCALMLVVQPVLAAVGELHELAHNPSGAHAGLVVDVGQTSNGPDSGTVNDAAAAVLHVLIDGAHVCGTGAAMAPLTPAVAAVPLDDPLVVRVEQRLMRAWVPTPFRPPIFA